MDAALEALIEKRKNLFNEMQELAKRDRSADEEARFDAASKEFDAVKVEEQNHLDKQNRSKQVADRVAELEKEQAEHRQGRGFIADHQERQSYDAEAIESRTERDRTLAVQAWARSGKGLELTEEHRNACRRLKFNPSAQELVFPMIHSRASEQWKGQPDREARTMTKGTTTAGGFTVPTGFQYELETKLLQWGGPRSVARILSTSDGQDIQWATWDDTGNAGALLAEETTMGSSVDPTIGQITLKAYKYNSTPVLVSSELLMDSAFNINQEVGGALGVRIGRGTSVHFTTGDNSSKPQGVVNGSALGVTAAGTTSITADELLGLIHSVDPAYRSLSSVGFMMHDNILLYIRKLKDGNGSYLWQPSFQAGVPDRLLQYPIAINQHMQSSVATGTKTMLFGAFEKFIIRDAGPMRMYQLNELYRGTDQTAFVAFSRHDSRYIQTAAVKHLIQA